MARARAGQEEYTPENLKAFAREYVLSEDAAKAYRKVFGTRKVQYNKDKGALVLGRGDVAELVARERERVKQAAIALEEGGEEQGGFDVHRRMELLQELAEDKDVSPQARVNALLKYEQLEELARGGEGGEDIGAELAEFIGTLRSTGT